MEISLEHIDLANPPVHFRPSPFWSWNDRLEPDELRRQIREMHRAGLGGFFMHARGGLQTEYLSGEWMECTRVCLDEAAELGMDAWLYDENGWPSGFGGGLVNSLGVRYQQKYLVHRLIPAERAAAGESTISFYSADGAVRYGREVPEGVRGEVLECFFEVNPYYVDNLDPVVVEEFLRVTHEHYCKHIPEKSLASLRGIFTDEPQLSRRGLLWSFVLEEEYRKAYARELLDELPLLFLDVAPAPAMRVRFWSLVAELFAVNFQKRIYDWCTAHHWQLTGHHVLEEDYFNQLTANGAIMPQYRYYHVPGMDHLTRCEPNVTAMIQLLSVAAQCGHRQVLTESFALCGWNFNFRGMKWLYQIQMAHGINYLCQHLAGYTLRGMRKRDYPLSSSCHQPWWGDYRKLNDYFSRVGMLLAAGEISADILVFHGESSAWCRFDGDNRCAAEIGCLSESLRLLSECLDGFRASYHYADELIVRQQGVLENGMIRIGQQSYRMALLPQLTNFSRDVFRLLLDFSTAGGRILGVRNQMEPGAMTIDGVPATVEERRLLNRVEWYDNEYAAAGAAAEAFPRLIARENGEEALQLISARRHFDDLEGRCGDFYLVVNRRAETECRAQLIFPGSGTLEIINPATGAFEKAETRLDNSGRRELGYDFAPAAAALFFLHREEAPESAAPTTVLPQLYSRLEPVMEIPASDWELAGGSPNLLTLDRCEYRVDNGEWIADDVSVIHHRLLKLRRECNLELRFRFHCREDFYFASPLKLVVETPEKFAFSLNGKPFAAKDEGYCFDRAFRIVSLPPVSAGENILTMKIHYRQPEKVYEALKRAEQFETEYNMLTFETEIESVYLLGDFGVACRGLKTAAPGKSCVSSGIVSGSVLSIPAVRWDGAFELTALPHRVNVDDLLESGFPFFAGRLRLQKDFELSAGEALSLRQIGFGVCGVNSVRLKINGVEGGECFWEPYTLPLPEGVLRAGKNTVEMEVVLPLRNLLGPHHMAEGESGVIGTLSFNKEPNVLGAAGPEYHRGYCFTRQGVTGMILG